MPNYLGNFFILFTASKGLKGKYNFIIYLLNNIAIRMKFLNLKDEDFKMTFKDVNFWIGVLSGELGAYIQIYMKNVNERIKDFVPQKGDAILDVGSNIGLYSIKNSSRVGPEGRIWAIEPNPTVFRRLLKNLETNGAINVTPVPKAVFSRSCKVDFAVSSGITPKGKILSKGESVNDNKDLVKVDCVTLDDFVSENRIKKIDIMKLDVEGEEYEALKGARLKALPIIDKIVLEYHGEDRKKECRRLLEDSGFILRSDDDKDHVLYFQNKDYHAS